MSLLYRRNLKVLRNNAVISLLENSYIEISVSKIEFRLIARYSQLAHIEEYDTIIKSSYGQNSIR